MTLSTICYTNRGERLYFPVKQENLPDGNELDIDLGSLGDYRINWFPHNASPKKLISLNNNYYLRALEQRERFGAVSPDARQV